MFDVSDVGYLPIDEVLAVVTASQGKPRATLARMAADNCFDLRLDVDNLVLFVVQFDDDSWK